MAHEGDGARNPFYEGMTDLPENLEDCLGDAIVMVSVLDRSLGVPLCGDDMPGVPSQGDYLRPCIGEAHPLAKLAEGHNGWFRIKYVCHDLREGRIMYLVEPGSP